MEKSVRQIALEVLSGCTDAAKYSNIALDTAIKRNPLSPQDRGLLTALVYGTIERAQTLDYYISVLSDRPLEELSSEVRNLLRLGLYQMAYLDRVPDHAAVNETVAVAPKRVKGFVNAVLRSFARADKQIPFPSAEENPVGYLSVRYSVSEPLAKHFSESFGFEKAETLLASFEKHPPLTLRVNSLKTTRDDLLSRFLSAGYEATPTAESKSGIKISGNAPIHELPGFDAGEWFVQDEASQICVETVDAKEGMTVLDLCACPGSKSFGIALSMNNRGTLVSADLHANKLSLVSEGAKRLGINILTVSVGDARTLRPEWVESADRVLCDVPCSGFGVFAKKPELRYKDPATSADLPRIQSAILDTASQYVKVGGKLIYSTCTLLPEENENNAEGFLACHPEYRLCSMRTLTPATDGTDGFFVAAFEKISTKGN